MAAQAGYLGKVLAATYTVLEMGSWSVSGMETDMLEDTQFTDTFKSYIPGQGDGGSVTVSGNYDPEDADVTEGQGYLMAAWFNKTAVATFYCYYTTAGYFGLNAGSAYVQSMELGTDQTGLATLSFVVKLSGGYFEKKA